MYYYFKEIRHLLVEKVSIWVSIYRVSLGHCRETDNDHWY